MQILIQADYKPHVQLATFEKKNLTEIVLDTQLDKSKKYNCLIGDSLFYKKLDEQLFKIDSVQHRILLLNESLQLKTQLYKIIQPSFIIPHDELHTISNKIESVVFKNSKNSQMIQARVNVEEKRDELEKLNEFLSYQDKERTTALKIFHGEEQLKKQHEKQLLFFLDFINSNYENSNFLDELLKYIWTEVKKVGSFYQMGILVKFDVEDQAVLFQYDDRKYYSQKSVVLGALDTKDAAGIASFLANLYQRPVGKILFWTESNPKIQFYFYLENQGKDYKNSEIESFVSDRMSLLSLSISRWVTEKSEKALLKQWRNTFKAYKDPIHVVDEKFNIVQANYITKLDDKKKCYEVLAKRDLPCENCPLVDSNEKKYKNKTNIEILDSAYEVHMTKFFEENKMSELSPRKYFLLFYENITEMNSLKSQVIQSEKMSTIGNLANHLAHELNNPLTGLKMNSEYLISEIESNNTISNSVNLVSDLKEILKATTRSEVIIKDLVDFSSDTAKEMQDVDFSVVLKKTMTLLKSVLRNNRVFIDVKSHFIRAQPVYLQQIIFNLVKNACEAMGSDGSIKIYQGISDLKHLDFIIEDNGPGMPDEMIADIFKPFFTTKKEGEGTGLGLYLCSNLMAKMNGELIYDKKFRSGARFILRFSK